MTITTLYEDEISRFDSIHHWLQHALELPDWYGHNLDALWDCLSGCIALPAEIHWVAAGRNDPNPDSPLPAGDSDIEQKLAVQIAACISLFEEAAEQIEGLSFKYIPRSSLGFQPLL